MGVDISIAFRWLSLVSSKELTMRLSKRMSLLSLAGLMTLAVFKPAFAADDVIRIGAPLALTGGLADEGKKQQVSYAMWLKRVNAAGGINVGGKK